MGFSASGVVSPPIPGFGVRMLSELLACDLRRVDLTWDIEPRFDARNKGDVAVVAGDTFCCIKNSEFVHDLLFHGDRRPYNRFLDVTGMRGRVVFFCSYSSGDAFGFSVFEDGRAVRHRLYQYAPLVGQPRRTERGELLAVERPWKPAILTEAERQNFDPDDLTNRELFRNEDTQEILGEHSLDSMLVDAALADEFGFAPQHGVTNGQAVRDEYYRAAAAQAAAEKVRANPRRPWWRLLLR